MIKLQAIGHLDKDAIVNNVNGKTVINFSVAHTDKYKDAQGIEQQKTIWVNCGYWTDRTAIAPYLKKGTQVFVEGQPDVRTYQTNAGATGANLECRVHNVQLLGGNNNQQQNNNTGSTNQQNTSAAAPIDDMPADSLAF